VVGLRVAVLGPTEAEVDGTPVTLRSVRQRRLLAALVLWRQGASTSRLADAVWGDALPKDPSGALANQVSRLRGVLGEVAIESVSGGYRLGSTVEVDVDGLDEDMVGDAPAGSPYEDLDVEDARVEAARLSEQLLSLRESRAEELLRDGNIETAASEAAALTAEHPLRERGTIVLAQALAAMGRRVEALRALDELRVRFVRDLGVDPSSEVLAVHRRLLGDDRSTVRRRPVHSASPLIGREVLIADVSAAIRTHRLVTVTGPGGVGKTAVAFAVGERAGTDIIDFVPLGVLRPGDDVAAAVAAQLNIDRGGETSLLQRITDVLAYEPGVLILDNAEHVLDGTTALVGELLARTPVRLLLTSRVRLGHADEHIVEMPTLSVTGDDGGTACELFVARARSARPGWEPTSPSEIIDICRRLDGLPLAIELAAAHLASRTLTELAGDLDHPVELLGDHTAGRPGLRGVVARSIRLLDPVDRTILHYAATFRGGVTADTLRTACRGIADERVVRGAVHRLVRASLLTQAERRYGTRYRLLETIRACVIDSTDGSEGELGARHAEAMLDLLEQGAVDAYGPDEPSWAERLVDERSNVLAALEHFAVAGDASRAARLAIAAYLIGIPRRHVDLLELPATAARLAEQSDIIDPALMVEILGLEADAAAYRGDSSRARGLIRLANGISASPHAHRYCEAVAADLALYSGDIEAAVDHLHRARVGFAQRDQPALSAWMSATIPLARSHGRHPDDQVGDALAALDAAEGTACPSTIAFARYVYAEVLRPRDRDEARQQHERALKEALSVDAFFVAALVRLSLATDATDRGDAHRSAVLLGETITDWLRLGNWAQQAITLRAAALLLARSNRHSAAVTILFGLDHVADHAAWGAEATTIATAMEASRRSLSEADLAAARDTAADLDRVQVVTHALTALDEIQSRPDSEHSRTPTRYWPRTSPERVPVGVAGSSPERRVPDSHLQLLVLKFAGLTAGSRDES
jgi:predicted ATPase/DNA-binding SARP family transcriptional activator